MPFPNPDTQFKPGQSGNPAGLSRKRRVTNALIALIEEKGADRALALRWLQASLEGDARFFGMLLDRVEGLMPKPPEDREDDGQTDPIEEINQRGRQGNGKRRRKNSKKGGTG